MVISAHQRREAVLASVQAFARQEFAGNFEFIVVADGSGEALRQLRLPFTLTVIEQANEGANAARNRGAKAAKGAIILFFNDDMEAHPYMITEHNLSHQEGTDAVMGQISLQRESPKTFLSHLLGQRTEERVNELSAIHGNLPFNKISTGQLSISLKNFFEIGGFDPQFTLDGYFGNLVLDFGLRLTKGGYKSYLILKQLVGKNM